VTDRAAVAPFAREELARRRLPDFLGLMHHDYRPAAHTQLLCEHGEAVEAGEIDRLMIFLPPRHGKSLHVSQALPAWFLGRQPRKNVILASYADELAHKNSRTARGFLEDDRWPFETRLSAQSHAAGRWNTTDGGGVIAAGVGAGITGQGADLMVLDDLIRDRADADSQAIRESTWAWLGQVAMTRLHRGAAVVYATTRWHEDDPAGRLLDSPGGSRWVVLRLPALAEEDDPLGRIEGEPLWPSEFDVEHFAEQRELMGPRAFAAVHQQSPTPEKGAIFERPWFDGRYAKVPEGLRIVQAVDSAFKTGVAHDYSVIATWGTDRRFFYLLDVRRAKMAYPQLVQAIKDEAAKWAPHRILVEDQASGQSVVQSLKAETGLPVVPVPAEGSKISRAESVTGLFEAGKVLLPEQSPAWLHDWIEEHVKFPGGKHDDCVDTTSHALRWMRGSSKTGGTVAGVVTHHAWHRDPVKRAAARHEHQRLRQDAASARRRAAALARPLGRDDPRYA
jgi:predicted phage terminase large subunit-like protein